MRSASMTLYADIVIITSKQICRDYIIKKLDKKRKNW